MSLAPRLILAIFPALLGTLTWEWLGNVTGDGYPYGIHPYWIYLWHPPLMDVLFGLVLASFVQARRLWWIRAGILVLASLIVHTVAVSAVADTQWILDPLIRLRFVSVVPVALIATILLTSVTAMVCGLTVTRRFLTFSTAAGVGAAVVFLLALEIDTTGQGWFWRNNVHWMLWHGSICAVLYYGIRRQRTSVG